MPVKEKEMDQKFGLLDDQTIDNILIKYGIIDYKIIPLIGLNKTILDITRKTETARKLLIKFRKSFFILKEFPWYCSYENFVEHEIQIQLFLRKNNLPVPKIISNINNKNYSEYKKSFFILQEYINGDSWDKNLEKTKSAGVALAQMHTKFFSFKTTQELKDKFREDIFSLCFKMIKLCENLFEKHDEKHDEKTMKEMEEYLRSSKNILKKIKKIAINKGYFEFAIPVHGDYNPFNLVFNNDKVTGILDFNNTCIDNPIHDLSEGLVHFSYIKYRPHTTLYEKLPDNIDKNQLSEFLKGYTKESPTIYNKIKGLLPLCMVSIVIELSALGLICGDYNYRDAKYLRIQNENALQKINILLEEL